MAKSIIDGPRSHESGRVDAFTKLDRQTSGKPAHQSEVMFREERTRTPGEKLRRFTRLERQG